MKEVAIVVRDTSKVKEYNPTNIKSEFLKRVGVKTFLLHSVFDFSSFITARDFFLVHHTETVINTLFISFF